MKIRFQLWISFGNMKFQTLCALALLVGCARAIQQCCEENDFITRRGRCNKTDAVPNVFCPNGRWLLKDIILHGTQVLTIDTAGHPYTEDPTQYCVGFSHLNSSDLTSPLLQSAVICFNEPSNSGVEATGILTLISVVFLVMTLAVYMYLPQMRDLQGLCYISMCVSMALGFLSLGILQFDPGFRNEICAITGFTVYFWMMATFFWMNVISINTYRSIVDPELWKHQRQEFFKYSCYAWGTSIFLLIVSISANFIEGNHWKPGIGEASCWFKGVTETWIFFYGPIAILITSNIGLFVACSIKLWQQNKKYEVDKLNILKHKFLTSLKLFLVMGVSWIFEIASFAHGQSTIIWKIMDTFNCLQGVVIFILLVVLRRRAIQGLANANFCLTVTAPLAQKLSPHDKEEEEILAEDTVEVRLN